MSDTFVTVSCPHCNKPVIVELAVRRPAAHAPKKQRAVDEFTSGPIRGKNFVDDGRTYDYPPWEDAPS